MEFKILGPVEAIDDSGRVPLGGPQQRRILGALLSDPNHVLTFDRLIEVLWPYDNAPDNARRSAISYISRLRTAIGNEVIGTNDAGYTIDLSRFTVDAHRFEHLVASARSQPPDLAYDTLTEALELWRGPVFGEFNDQFWSRSTTAKLDELRLIALANRLDAVSTNGWDSRGVIEAQSLVAAHPLHAAFVERLMTGLHATGRTAEALRIFQSYRESLIDLTGLDPSPALVALDSHIASGASIDTTTPTRALRGYVISEVIGHGTYGTVYRATQPSLDRTVAIKAINAEWADNREFIRRFEHEAQLVARLEHPHIVPLYDYWREPGNAYLVFRLLNGGNAEQRLADHGPVSLEQATRMIDQLGGALRTAHRRGVIHRDIKPTNILLDDDLDAYLTDFGIAAQITTSTELFLGSPMYASPEQLRGEPLDERSDQYSFAVTLWELLTGRTPFDGTTQADVVSAKLLGHMSAPVSGSVPILGRLDDVLRRAVALHPGDRFDSIVDFVGAWHDAITRIKIVDTDPGRRDLQPGAQPSHASDTSVTPTALVTNPYKGLRHFEGADAADFFGREDLVDELACVIEARPFTAILGASGSGKSSVVLAGLVPRMQSNGTLVVTLTPGAEPFESMAQTLLEVLATGDAALANLDALKSPGGVANALLAAGNGGQVVVVIDQFEELWTSSDSFVRESFTAALADVCLTTPTKVIATLRADWLDRPLRDQSIGTLVARSSYGIMPLTAAELTDAIIKPAERIGVRFEAGLAARIVAEAIDQPGPLPLLQFALAECFEHRTGSTITTADYDQIGGLSGAIAVQAEALYASFDTSKNDDVRNLFSRLVIAGDGARDTRRRALRSELTSIPDAVIDAFAQRRLLTLDRDKDSREPTVEVAHESLLSAWPRLQRWLDGDRAWVRELRGLAVAASAWDATGRNDADLYRGSRLALSSELAETRAESLTTTESQFLENSNAFKAREFELIRERNQTQALQNRRLRRSLVGVGVLLLVALATSAFAAAQGRRADNQAKKANASAALADNRSTEANTQKAAAQKAAEEAAAANRSAQIESLVNGSIVLRDSQQDVATLLAVEADRLAPSAKTKSGLFATFTRNPGFIGYTRTPDIHHFNNLIPIGSGDTGVATVSYTRFPPDNSVVPIDLRTGAIGAPFDEPATSKVPMESTLSLSRNEKVLARLTYGDANETVDFFDMATKRHVGATIVIPEHRATIALNNDGSLVAVAGGTPPETVVYRTGDSAIVGRFHSAFLPTILKYSTASAAFGPDDRLYAGGLDGEISVLDVATMQPVKVFHGQAGGANWGVFVAADLSYVVGYGDRRIERFDLSTGSLTWTVASENALVDRSTPTLSPCTAAALASLSRRLYCADASGSIKEYDAATGAQTGKQFDSQIGFPASAQVTADGASLIVAGNNNNAIARWKLNGTGPIQRVVAHEYPNTVGNYDAGGTYLLVGKPNGGQAPLDITQVAWDPRNNTLADPLTETLVGTFSGVPNQIFGGFSTTVGIAAGMYNVTSHARVAGINVPIDVTKRGVPRAYFDAPHHRFFLTWDDGSVETFDDAGHNIGPTITGERATRVGVTADGTTLVISDLNNGTSTYDATTGKKLGPNFPELWDSATSSHDIVVGSLFDGHLYVADAHTLKNLGELPGSRGAAPYIGFSDDGSLVMVRAGDRSVTLYDVASQTKLGDSVLIPETAISNAALRPDGKELAIPDGVNGIALWDLDQSHWAAAACGIAGRNLTHAEWDRYLGQLGTYHATCSNFPSAPTT